MEQFVARLARATGPTGRLAVLRNPREHPKGHPRSLGSVGLTAKKKPSRIGRASVVSIRL